MPLRYNRITKLTVSDLKMVRLTRSLNYKKVTTHDYLSQDWCKPGRMRHVA